MRNQNFLKYFIIASGITSSVWAQSGKDDLAPFRKALEQYRAAQYDTAITSFKDLLKSKSNLDEYAHFYLGQSLMKTNKLDEAEKEFNRVLELSPNARMSIEASDLIGQIALEKKSYKQAQVHFQRLEKRTRNTESHAEILYHLAIAEKGLNHHSAKCKWLAKIYEKYPTYEKVQSWGLDLAANEFEGKASECSNTTENFRNRVRSLMWAGQDQKAQNEITAMKEKLAKTEPFAADKLQAQFYMQEGETAKALELLKPYYEDKKRNFDFLTLFASAAARTGEVPLAVGSYYSAYTLAPRSKTARQALYQAAFLSYQFQDYDGAARRFHEFMKVYPNSGLTRDAQWHLAWIKYLKGDYQGSYKAFSDLQMAKKRKRHAKIYPEDRVTYWMAMSLYRQGKSGQARSMMEKLAKDPLLGYYAIAAQARLRKFEALKIANPIPVSPLATQPKLVGRYFASEFLMPSLETAYQGNENESEDDLASSSSQYASADEEEANETEEAVTADNPDMKSVDVAEDGQDSSEDNAMEIPSSIASPVLLKRFERARDLLALGEKDWARWDLFDIEKKTRNRDLLKSLLSEYTMTSSFNRSAFIAQTTFGGQRASMGIEGTRPMWEFAYPRAYSVAVEKYTKQFSVPEELVWGIMRAESSYRQDAISPVGALGLMQVMPFTGHKVANLIGDKDFKAPQLLEPDTAVKIGSRYLKRLMEKFDNTIPLVAAGYNAGPHRVKGWLASFGNLETDEFIEHIPYLETRNYVKRVVSNSYVYSKLYGRKKDLFPYLADSVPVKVIGDMSATKENWDDI
jgi:soluble lytic murein transglycosylase